MTRPLHAMDFRILGPLEVLDEGRAVAIVGGKQRALLALLLLHGNETLSTDRLIEELWQERPPASAAKTVHVHVSRLRKALADPSGGNGASGVLVTREHGYELRLDPERLDAHRFEELAEDGRRELMAGRPARAASMFDEALALWRGPTLADLAYEAFAQPYIARLDELRIATLEQLIEAKLALGRHAEVVGQLEALIGEHPYREGLRAQVMLALYRCDRQAEALQAYHEARKMLVEELGIEPGPRLRDLERAILAQDPALALSAPEAAELPPELDAGTPLFGRDTELAWLREHWRRTRGGGGLVLVAGAQGIGKTRLAAELAGEIRQDGGEVLYASGAGSAAAARPVLARAGAVSRPALLVLDDVDCAREEIREPVRELVDGLAALPLLVVATAEEAALADELRAGGTLTLAPLTAEAAQRIVRVYGEDIPFEPLLEASGGIPARLHRAARKRVRFEASRRVSEAASRAANERAGLRLAEDDLAGGVVQMQAFRESTESDAGLVVCPFKGLASFDVDDAPVFFGRERLVAEMVARLAGAPLMGVVGPSGGGKSSALRAGLLASLAAGVLPGSEHWTLALLRPGEHPLAALQHALADAAPRRTLVVAVDQFEEIFTACEDESERGAFVDALLAGVRRPERRTIVLIAVRADYYGRCAAYPELSRLLGANHVLVGPMRRDELRRAIELPARRAGLHVDAELVDALVDDVDEEPGALPLLSSSLLELWQHRDGRRLRMSVYEQSGGVHGAVARLAERAYERLDADQRDVARRILLRLAGEGEGDAVVRRRVPLAELEADRDQAVGAVLAVLADDRLVTIDEGDVEVAHEALLREWPRLRGWLEQDEQGRRLHRHVRAAATTWDAGGRDPSELYRGARLAAALDWAASHAPELNAMERAFLDASRRASGRAHRRLLMVLAGVASLLVLAVIASVVALNERGAARAGATTAAAQRLGAQALVENDLDRSLLLARQGVALDDSIQTRGNLLAALLKSPAAIGVLREGDSRVTSLDLSPDGHTLALVDDQGDLRFIDVRTRRPAAPPLRVEGTTAEAVGDFLRFSNDGTLLAVGGWLPFILDVRTHRVVTALLAHKLAYGLRFSPDGHTVILALGGPLQGSTSIQRYDTRTGRRVGSEHFVNRGAGAVSLLRTSDGRRLVTSSADSPTVIRDARTLRVLKRLPVRAAQAALSPDDRMLLVAGGDGSVRFVDLVTGAVRIASGRHNGAVVRATFSADGRTAVTAGEDDRMIVWNVPHAVAADTLAGHAGQITALTISRDGQTLYSASLDGTVLVWDLGGARRLGRPFSTGPAKPVALPHFDRVGVPLLARPLVSYALSRDGRLLAVGNGAGLVTLIDARTLRTLSTFRAVPHGPVSGIEWIPGVRRLVVGGGHGFLAVVDPGSGALVERLRGHRATVLTPSFSADGRLMASASFSDRVLLWTFTSGRPIGRPRSYYPSSGPAGASLSPDGRTLLVTSSVGVDVVDVATLRRRMSLPGAETVSSLARFTPDGRFVVGGSTNGWARLWSTDSWRPATRQLAGHNGEVLWESLSPDGRLLATGSTDGVIQLFDLRTQQLLGAPLPALPNRPAAPQFTPDGAYLLAITDAGRAYRWDLRPSAWKRRACAVAGRTLTRAEWHDALPDRAYRPACPG